MKNYIEFDPCSNRFEYVGYDIDKYRDYIPILNELINNIPVEYNDYKLLCKEFIISWDVDFPYLFFNQHIIKEKFVNILT